MADTKISALAANSPAEVGNEIPVNDSGTSKKITLADVKTLMQTLGMPRVFAMTADHTISAAAGSATEVTQMGTVTLEAGTYMYEYQLIVQSATITVGISLGVNFTGTAAVRTILMMVPSSGTTAITGIWDDVGAATGQLVEQNVQTAFSTATPNLGPNTAGFVTANANVPMIIGGILVVTAPGDLELWHSSETATATSVKAGSSLSVIRTA